MSRRWRTLWWGLASLPVLLIAVAALIVATVNPEKFRPQIEREVRARTGLPLTLNGPLRWSLWPLLAIDAGGGSLQVAGESTPMLGWRNLQVSASLFTLIRGRWEIGGLALDGLQLHLRREADGHGNWEFLFAAPDAAANGANPAAGSPVQPGAAVAQPLEIHLRSLTLGDASIDYTDVPSGDRYAVRALNLQTAVDITEGGNRIAIDTLAMGCTALAPALRNDGVALGLSLRKLRLDTAKQTLDVKSYELGIASARVEGAIESAAMAGYALHGPVKLALPGVRQWLADLGVDAPHVSDASALGALTLSANWQYDAQSAQLDELALKIDDTQLVGNARWWFAASDSARGHGQFALKADRINLDRYQTAADPKGEPFELPIAMLKSLPVAGELEVASADFAGSKLRGVRVRFIDEGRPQ